MAINVLALRMAAETSQMDAAKESGIPRFTWWMLESGRQIATPEQELQIKKALSRILRKRAARFRALLAEELVQPEQPLDPNYDPKYFGPAVSEPKRTYMPINGSIRLWLDGEVER